MTDQTLSQEAQSPNEIFLCEAELRVPSLSKFRPENVFSYDTHPCF